MILIYRIYKYIKCSSLFHAQIVMFYILGCYTNLASISMKWLSFSLKTAICQELENML